MDYHQVGVKGNSGHGGKSLYDAESEGDIGHESAVHHVQVNPVGGGVEHLHLRIKVQKISGKK